MNGSLKSDVELAITRLTKVGDILEVPCKQDSRHHLMSAVGVLQQCRAALTSPPSGVPDKVLSVDEMSAAMDDAKATAVKDGYGSIVPDAVLIRAVERAVLVKVDRMLRHAVTPAAYLVSGGRMYRDKVFLDAAQAESSVAERNDGAHVEPLCRIGVPGVVTDPTA